MAQSLLIGLGGTGSRVVNNVVKELQLNKKEINNGEMCCAVLDTNENDNEKIVNSKTGVPVFPTSKAQKIRDYFNAYRHLHMETWCPSAPAFLEESMIDGASEFRMKSRIAFMDCLESGVIDQLESLINDILKNNSGSKIRVMIVSSLAGGTGSGMFIQVALWLRKFLSQSQITIRGIFLLPDVFISTLKDVRDNKATVARHYSNAYAAIRELNAISKIRSGNATDLPEKIVIGDLFDSTRDNHAGKPVFDYVFFVDNKDENGVRFESMPEYEQMMAQMVYMQLYAPMKDDMYSEEDNTFLVFTQSEEPLYGSCGTSKAVYPFDSVRKYCAVRAAQDSLTGGWKKIDSEIAALIEEKKQGERDGVFSAEVIDQREQFIRLYEEKTSVTADETGRDRFFLSISKDSKNEQSDKVDNGKTIIKYTDKVEDFISLLNSQKIDTAVTRHSGTDAFAIDSEMFVSADHTPEELKNKSKEDERGLEEVLDQFDAKVDEYANEIVNSVFPYSMGEVNAGNRCTIYGLLTKPNTLGGWDFIHPVAARYVLYKLVSNMEKVLKRASLEASRDDACTGGDVGTLFDNKATKSVTETDVASFLDSRRWYQREGAFLDSLAKNYAQFINGKIALCEKYEKECLQVSVYKKLVGRVNGLIQKVETFFKELDDVQKKFADEIAKNINETNGTIGKIIYVCGSKDAKEAIYKTLDFDLKQGNTKVSKSVVDSIYGRLCAEKRPSNPENAKYGNIGVVDAFKQDLIAAFDEKIDSDSDNEKKLNMDIYTALCREREIAGDAAMVPGDEGALRACVNRLERMAAPFLIYDDESPDNELGIVTKRSKTFWGFHPDVKLACPRIGAILGINDNLQSAEAYPTNELYCYRAVYGLKAASIPKFNEVNGGVYYTYYSSIINGMVKDANGKQGDAALVRTPHIDKTWHTILPYVSAEKQRQDELEFFHGFWLAVAYGMIRSDDGTVYLRRPVDSGHGSFIDEDVKITYKNKSVTKTEVAKLIEVLRGDKAFTDFYIPELEKRFAEEIDDAATYVSTDVMKGLTKKKDDLNPIYILIRYHAAPQHDIHISAALVGALEKIASELAEKCNIERTEKQLEEAKYKICRKIYDSCKRIKGKSELFGRWEAAFEKFKIKEEVPHSDSSV